MEGGGGGGEGLGLCSHLVNMPHCVFVKPDLTDKTKLASKAGQWGTRPAFFRVNGSTCN